jgi:hypothetical protein
MSVRLILRSSFLQKSTPNNNDHRLERHAAKIRGCLVLAALPPQPLQLVSLPIDLALITANFLFLPVILLFLALKLIADESARAQPETAADRGSCRGMTHGATDKTAHRRAAERANARALFPSRQWPAGAAGDENSSSQQQWRNIVSQCCDRNHIICSFLGDLIAQPKRPEFWA